MVRCCNKQLLQVVCRKAENPIPIMSIRLGGEKQDGGALQVAGGVAADASEMVATDRVTAVFLQGKNCRCGS